MSSYKITNIRNRAGNDKPVNFEKSMSAVSRYLKSVNAGRGSSTATIKRNFRNNDVVSVGNYRIEKVFDNNPSNFVNKRLLKSKSTKKQIVKQGKMKKPRFFGDIRYNVKRIENIVIKPKLTRRDVNDKEFTLNKYEIDIKNFLIKKVRNTPLIKKKYIQFLIEFKSSDDDDTLKYVSTAYGRYNEAIAYLEEMISDLLNSYDATQIISLTINTKKVRNIDNLIVFGHKKALNDNKMLDNYINSRLSNEYLDKKGVRRLVRLLKNCILISPNTTDNCLIQACFIAYHQTRDVQNYTDAFIKKMKKGGESLKKTIGNIINLWSTEYETNVKVILAYNLESKTYGDYDIEDTIEIFVYASHSYAIFDKEECPEELKDTDLELCNEEEYLIEEKTVKNIPEKYKATIGTYDFETCNKQIEDEKYERVKCYAGGIYVNNIYKDFFKKEIDDDVITKFLKYIMGNDTPKNMKLYAHNGGKFDIWLLIEKAIYMDNIQIESIITQHGRVINVAFKKYKSGKQIVFRDSVNFFACSLAKACKSFPSNIAKLEGDVNHNIVTMNNSYINSTEKIEGKNIKQYVRKYLKYDCLSLYNCLTEYNKVIKKKWGFDCYASITNAGIARKVFLTKYYDSENYPLYTLKKSIDNKLRPFYFGGRNECFGELGYKKGKYYYYDYTSHYPSQQGSKMFPYGEMDVKEIKPKYRKKFNKKWFGLVEIDVKHKEGYDKNVKNFHCLVDEGKLIFPHIEKWRRMICTTEEIKYSIENNLDYEYKFYKVYNYKKKDKYFKELIDDIFKMKKNAKKKGENAMEATAKVIINSTYGFFGQNVYDKEQVILDVNKDNDKREALYNSFLTDGSLKQHTVIDKYDVYKYNSSIDADCVVLPIAMFCSSYARIELHRLMVDIEKQGGFVVYCDTDSIISDIDLHTNKFLYDKYINCAGGGGGNLTEMTNETDDDDGYYTEMVLLGCKQYALKTDFQLKESPNKMEVLKFKGINIKAKYDKKEYDHEKKLIILTGLNSISGTEKVVFEDYKKVADGYKIVSESLNFSCSINSIFYDNQPLVKKVINKSVGKLYTKGDLDGDKITSKAV